jgi:hypothetical protein
MRRIVPLFAEVVDLHAERLEGAAGRVIARTPRRYRPFIKPLAVDRDGHALGELVDLDQKISIGACPSGSTATVAAASDAKKRLIRKDAPASAQRISRTGSSFAGCGRTADSRGQNQGTSSLTIIERGVDGGSGLNSFRKSTVCLSSWWPVVIQIGHPRDVPEWSMSR